MLENRGKTACEQIDVQVDADGCLFQLEHPAEIDRIEVGQRHVLQIPFDLIRYGEVLVMAQIRWTASGKQFCIDLPTQTLVAKAAY